MCQAEWPRRSPVSAPGTWFWFGWFGRKLTAPSHILAVAKSCGFAPRAPASIVLVSSLWLPSSISCCVTLPMCPISSLWFTLHVIATEFSPKPALLRFFHGSGTFSSFLKPNSSQMGRAHFHLASLPFQPAFLLFSSMYSMCSNPAHLEDEAWDCPLLCNPPLLCAIHILSRWGMCPLKESGWVVKSSSCRASLAEFDFCSALYYCDLRPVTGDNSSTYLVG